MHQAIEFENWLQKSQRCWNKSHWQKQTMKNIWWAGSTSKFLCLWYFISCNLWQVKPPKVQSGLLSYPRGIGRLKGHFLQRQILYNSKNEFTHYTDYHFSRSAVLVNIRKLPYRKGWNSRFCGGSNEFTFPILKHNMEGIYLYFQLVTFLNFIL